MIPKDSGLSVAPHSAFYVAYQTNGSWTANDKKSPGSADSLSLDTLGVINLSVVREEASPKARTGIVVYDGARTVTSLVNSFDILPSRGSEFKLMRETPGTLYAIRVYDRVLTDAERAQNHFADVCNFYQLDLSDFYNTAILPEIYRQEVYDAMLDIDFSLTREKAKDYGAAGVEMLSFYDELTTPSLSVAKDVLSKTRSAGLVIPCFSAGATLYGERLKSEIEKIKSF